MLATLALVLFAQSGTVSPTGASFGAHLLIADGDGTDKYLRALAFDEETKTLYGLEQNELVKVNEKFLLTKVQSVGKVKYGEERNAVGVSSGISQLLPLGGGRLLLIPKSGDTLVVSAGKVSPLKAK